jgi:hypothetical protein
MATLPVVQALRAEISAGTQAGQDAAQGRGGLAQVKSPELLNRNPLTPLNRICVLCGDMGRS